MRIALVVYEGVLADECEAFRSVLSLIDDAEMVVVGPPQATVAGPGGSQRIDLSYRDLAEADIVVVPGGIGCERATDDERLREFLQRIDRSARWVAASSTGSVVIASAGLLRGQPAATHWLAHELLHKHGSAHVDQRVVMNDHIITCVGAISAVQAAFSIVERVAGPLAVTTIRETLLARGAPLTQPESRWARLRRRAGHRPARGDSAAPPKQPITPVSVLVELVDDDDLARRIRRHSRHRRRR